MEGQPDNRGEVLALLKGAQEGAVNERSVFKGGIHTATLQPAFVNVKENLSFDDVPVHSERSGAKSKGEGESAISSPRRL